MAKLRLDDPKVFFGSSDGGLFFHGPEIMGSYIRPFGKTKLSGKIGLTALPVVLWKVTADSPAIGDKDGVTLGYSGDIGLIYEHKPVTVSAGYKIFSLQPENGKVSWGADLEDQTAGLYLEGGFEF